MPAPERETTKYPKPNIDDVILSTAISQIHIPPLVQPLLTLAIAKGFSSVPPEMRAEVAISIFVTSLLLGYLYEVETLKKLGFTSNPLTVLTYMKIRHPYLATAIGDILGQIVHTVNPVDLAYTSASLANGDGGHLFYANLISRSIVGYAFVTGFNWALRHGHAEKIVAKIHELREQLMTELTRPPRIVDYPDNTSGDFHAWLPAEVVKSNYGHY